MHLPDGFLDTKTIVATTTLSLAGVGAAWVQTRRTIEPQRIPLLGVTAAFVFAAQMLNFPVAGGTSGHLMGAVLASVLVGPTAAVIIITSVLVVQCLLFADGGVLALGANIFNMAIVGSLAGGGIYRIVYRMAHGETGRAAAVAVASWCSVVLASVCCAGELAWSGTTPWAVAFPAMAGIHSIIGVGEALISCLVVVAIRKTRPELLADRKDGIRMNSVVVLGLIIAIGLVLFVSPFASQWPDGLERVATLLGFDQRVLDNPGLIPDYHFPGFASPTIATIVAGIAGVGVVFLGAYLFTRLLGRKPSQAKSTSS